MKMATELPVLVPNIRERNSRTGRPTMSGGKAVCACVALLAVASAATASISVSSRGMWPDSWPPELDAYRAKAKTVAAGTVPMDLHEVGHEITFADRGDFEKAWPYILKVKSRGASIILEQGPSKRWITTVPAGVRILCPGGSVSRDPEGKDVIAGPPYPDHLRSEDGVMPEYVVGRDGKYAAFDGTNGESFDKFVLRARVDIVLVVDGDIVDLNRIYLPPDTPIIDNRFKERHSNPDAHDGSLLRVIRDLVWKGL